MPGCRHRDAAGFSLVEALIASLLAASAIVGLAHLVTMAAEQSLTSRRAASALTIAQGKLEQLRRLPFWYRSDGTRFTSAALALSPVQSIQEDTSGYVEYLDSFGEVVALDGSAAPDFARRWSVSTLDSGDYDTLVLHVCVFAVLGPTARGAMPVACASGIRTRQP